MFLEDEFFDDLRENGYDDPNRKVLVVGTQ